MKRPVALDPVPYLPRGCEHGRVVLAVMSSTFGGEQRICAGDAWDYGFFANGWPEAAGGAPDSRIQVACECACVCPWSGPFGETNPDQGVLRCHQCAQRDHPPIPRWTADIMGTDPTELRW